MMKDERDLTTILPNSQKGREYIIRHAVAILDRHSRGRTVVMPGEQNDPVQRHNDGRSVYIWRNIDGVRAARQFARGLDSGRDWMRQHTMKDSSGKDVTTRGHDFATSKLWVKYCNLFVEQMQRRTSLRVEVFDPEVRRKNAKAKFKVLARIKESLNPDFKRIMSASPVPEAAMMGPGEPQSEQEFTEWSTGEYKDDQSRTIEILVDAARRMNDYDLKIRPRIAEELRDAGIVTVLTELDPYGIPKVSVWPFEETILPDTKDNWANPQFAAVQVNMTIDDIAIAAGSEIPDEYLRAMSKFRNGDRTQTFRVWKVWFIDTLEETYATDQMGNRVEIPEGAPGDGMTDVRRLRVRVVFQCNLVEATGVDLRLPPGSSHWEGRFMPYGAGLCQNQIKYRDSLGQARLPLFAHAVGMEEMRVKSLAQRAMEQAWPFEALWQELKHLIGKIIPPGPFIDSESIQNAISDTTVDGNKYDLKARISLLKDEGAFIYDRVDLSDPQGVRPEKLFLNQGVIPEFTRILDAMNGILQMFEQALGFNEATAARDAEARSAVRNLQMIAAGTTAALSPYTRAMDTIELEIGKRIYGCWQNAYRIAGRTRSIPGQIFGDAVERNVELTIDNDPVSLGFHLDIGATDEDLSILATAMGQSTQADPQALTIADQMYVMELAKRNVKLAARVLGHRIERNKAKAQENQKEMIALDQQKVQMAAEAQMQQMMAKLQAESEMKMGIEQFKAQTLAEIEQMRQTGSMELEQLRGQIQAMLLGEELGSKEGIADGLNESNERMNTESLDSSEREEREKARVQLEVARISADSRAKAASKPPVGKKN